MEAIFERPGGFRAVAGLVHLSEPARKIVRHAEVIATVHDPVIADADVPAEAALRTEIRHVFFVIAGAVNGAQ